MKKTNCIWSILAISAIATFSSCSVSMEGVYGRPVYGGPPRPPVVVRQQDLPPAPDLSPRQIDAINQVRAEERRRVEYLEGQKDGILSDIHRLERSDFPRDREMRSLQDELRRTESAIDQAHRSADKRVHSILTRQQRRCEN